MHWVSPGGALHPAVSFYVREDLWLWLAFVIRYPVYISNSVVRERRKDAEFLGNGQQFTLFYLYPW